MPAERMRRVCPRQCDGFDRLRFKMQRPFAPILQFRVVTREAFVTSCCPMLLRSGRSGVSKTCKRPRTRSRRQSFTLTRGGSCNELLQPEMCHEHHPVGENRTSVRDASTEKVFPFRGPLLQGKLSRRYKRFLADVDLPGVGLVQAHCPNPGSMRGMGLDARPCVLLSEAPPASKRKMVYTLEAVKVDADGWVGCNTVLPNAIIGAWLTSSARARELFGNFSKINKEVRYGTSNKSRVDFVLQYEQAMQPSLPLYVEVKNVTMSWDTDGKRVALFPDSKTERGQKHLRELINVQRSGVAQSCCLYFINRQDTSAFAPCTIDMKYVDLFREAHENGVRILPLVFALRYDESTGRGMYEYVRELPLHAESGP